MGQRKLYSLVLLLATFSLAMANNCISATGSGDLHVHEPGGGSFDFKGKCHTWFVMHQAAGSSLNALFTCDIFALAPEDPRSKGVVAVEGSHMTAIGAVFKTTTNNKPATVYVSYAANRKARVLVKMDNEIVMDSLIQEQLGEIKVGSVKTQMMSDSSLSLSNSEWKYVLTPGTFRLASGERSTRFDGAVVALKDPRDSPVAAHGVLGQGFDGLYIEGKKDDYIPGMNGIFVTSAQGESSIEGKPEDYVVDGPFATNFTYDRIDKLMAPPRDTTFLNVVPQSGGAGRQLNDCEPATTVAAPTKAPTDAPSTAPSDAPTDAPSTAPSDAPTNSPIVE